MADKLLDRYSIPDASAKIRGEEGGNKVKWENMYHPEEVVSEDFVPSKERIKGGGEGGFENLVNNLEGSDPEMRLLLKDFLSEEHPEVLDEDGDYDVDIVGRMGREFDNWLSDSESDKSKDSEITSPSFYEEEEKDGRRKAEYNIWNNPETLLKVKTAILSKDDGIQRMLRPTLREFLLNKFGTTKKTRVLEQMADPSLEENTIKSLLASEYLHYLKEQKKRDVVNKIRYKVGTVSKRELDLKPKYPKFIGEHKVNEVDTEGFNLVLYQPALDRLTEGADGEVAKAEAERNKGAVKDFWGTWTHGPSEIEAIGFGTDEKNSQISSVIMRLKDGSSITLPAHVFRRVFDVRLHTSRSGTQGLEFIGGRGVSGFIDSDTPDHILKNIMRKVNINGVKLNPNVKFWVGRYEKLAPNLQRKQALKV